MVKVLKTALGKKKKACLCGELAGVPEFILFLGGVLSDEELRQLGKYFSPSVSGAVANQTKEIFRWLENPEIKKSLQEVVKPYEEFLLEEDLIHQTQNKTRYKELQEKLNSGLKDVLDRIYKRIDKALSEGIVLKASHPEKVAA